MSLTEEQQKTLRGELYSTDRADPDKCSGKGKWAGYTYGRHQCSNKPKKQLGGHGLCNKHYKELQAKLGMLEDTLTAYQVTHAGGELCVKEFKYHSETDKTITTADGKTHNKERENIHATLFGAVAALREKLEERLATARRDAQRAELAVRDATDALDAFMQEYEE